MKYKYLRGVSLIELMIALTAGLIVIGAVGALRFEFASQCRVHTGARLNQSWNTWSFLLEN